MRHISHLYFKNTSLDILKPSILFPIAPYCELSAPLIITPNKIYSIAIVNGQEWVELLTIDCSNRLASIGEALNVELNKDE